MRRQDSIIDHGTCKHITAPCASVYTWWGYELTKTVQNAGPHAISEILHIEYQIVCFIETYLIYTFII